MNLVRNINKLSAMCFLLVAATGLSAAETAGFPFFKLITIPENAKDISAFTIDADIYRETAQIPNGIRIVGPNDEFCPFVVSEELQFDQERAAKSDIPATVTGFETLPDGSVRISVSANPTGIPDSADPHVVGLKIRTSAKDFDKKVKVFGKNGETLIAEGAFLDYSSRVNLRNDTVQFPVPVKEFGFVIVMDNYTEIKDSPLFRVVEGDSNIVEQEKFRESPKIEGILLQVVQKQKSSYPVSASLPVTILSQEKKGKKTVIAFSNGFAPLKSITVESSDVFFSRPYRLYNGAGILVAAGVARKLETASFRTLISDRVIEVPVSSRSERWTLELENGENDELKGIELHANGPVYQVRFLSSIPSMTVDIVDALKGTLLPCYKVYYGADAGQPMPSSGFADVLQSGDEPVPSESRLSEQLPNPRFDEYGVSVKDWGLVYKILMAVAAFAVFVILIVSVKKIDKVEG